MFAAWRFSFPEMGDSSKLELPRTLSAGLLDLFYPPCPFPMLPLPSSHYCPVSCLSAEPHLCVTVRDLLRTQNLFNSDPTGSEFRIKQTGWAYVCFYLLTKYTNKKATHQTITTTLRTLCKYICKIDPSEEH